MSQILTITAGTLPSNFTVVSWQEVLDAFSDYQTVVFDEDFKLFIIKQSQPEAVDQDKVWFEVDGDGSPVDIKYWNPSVSPPVADQWESFIAPTSYPQGSLIAFDVNGEQMQLSIGSAGQYLGNDGTDLLWESFDAEYGSTAGRLLYFNNAGYWDQSSVNGPTAPIDVSLTFGTHGLPTDTYQCLIIPQLFKNTTGGTGSLIFKDGSTSRQVFDYQSENADGDSSFSYTHALECILTDGQIPTLVATGQTRLLGAQLMVFQI